MKECRGEFYIRFPLGEPKVRPHLADLEALE
jgi:hypothetical protein